MKHFPARKEIYFDGSRTIDYNQAKLCPRCYQPLPIGYVGATSRIDDTTEICSQCGVEKALIPHIKIS